MRGEPGRSGSTLASSGSLPGQHRSWPAVQAARPGAPAAAADPRDAPWRCSAHHAAWRPWALPCSHARRPAWPRQCIVHRGGMLQPVPQAPAAVGGAPRPIAAARPPAPPLGGCWLPAAGCAPAQLRGASMAAAQLNPQQQGSPQSSSEPVTAGRDSRRRHACWQWSTCPAVAHRSPPALCLDPSCRHRPRQPPQAAVSGDGMMGCCRSGCQAMRPGLMRLRPPPDRRRLAALLLCSSDTLFFASLF